MKASVSFAIDCELLAQFAVSLKNQKLKPDDVVEKIIRDYLSKGEHEDGSHIIDPGPPSPPPPLEYIKLTEKLIMKCKKYKIGKMAQTLLRKFLSIGVFSENEIVDMQKIPGAKGARKLGVPQGDYANRNFGLNFPLLVREGTSDFLKAKCWSDPIQIGDETYYICAQWFEQPNNNDRIPLEKWIMDHLPIWFTNADEKQRKAMEDFIEWDI